jgi:hypothetical protein
VVTGACVVVTGASVVVTGASVVVTGASVVVTGASVVVTGASVVVTSGSPVVVTSGSPVVVTSGSPVVVPPPPGGVVGGVAVVVDVPPPPPGVVVGSESSDLGEAAAWAGTMTDFTSGFVQLAGSVNVAAAPPIKKTFRICLRSCDPRPSSMAIPPNPTNVNVSDWQTRVYCYLRNLKPSFLNNHWAFAQNPYSLL